MVQAERKIRLLTDRLHLRALLGRAQKGCAERAKAASPGDRGDQRVTGRTTAHAAQHHRVFFGDVKVRAEQVSGCQLARQQVASPSVRRTYASQTDLLAREKRLQRLNGRVVARARTRG